jgi:O-antigen/teichoic acid export membrane protein
VSDARPPAELFEPGSPPEQGLAQAAVGGVAWQGFSYLLGKLLVLASTVILARLLTPKDFGIVALALLFITYVEIASDLGVAQALIYLPRTQERTDAALMVAFLFSLFLVVVGVLSAPAVAAFFGQPEIAPMFRVLSLSLLVAGTGQVPDALLRKELRFRQRVRADVSRSVANGAVAIGLALAGFGPWSIVIGYLAAGAVWSAVLWLLVDYRPSRGFWRVWRLRWDVAKPLVSYGAPAAANGVLLSLVFDVDYLIVGRRLGADALGYYALGFRIPEMVIINVFYVLSAVAFPVLSRTSHDLPRLRRGYLRTVRIQTVYGVGAGVGLALVAPYVVLVLFGSKWIPSIVPLEALALYAAFRSLGIGAIDVYKALGRPGLAVTLSFVRLAVLVPTLVWATTWGINGVSWAQAVVALAMAVLMQTVAWRVLRLPARSLVPSFGPALAAGVGVALAAGAVRLWLPGSNLVLLVAGVLAGAAGGLLALRLVDRSFVPEVLELIRLRRRSPAPP